jgi:hypothetical protein
MRVVSDKSQFNIALALLVPCVAIASAKSGFALPPARTDGSFAADSAPAECKAVYNAADKLLAVPHHVYMTEIAAFTNGEPRQSELIFVGGVSYVRVSGRWTKSPLTVEQSRQQEAENRKTATNQSCRHLRDEAVNGEAAALYTAHAENAGEGSDTQVWISKSRGLILKQEEDFGDVGAKDKTHMSIRYDYGNIQAPKM